VLIKHGSFLSVIIVHVQLVSHGISKDDDDEYTASSKLCLVSHFCMHVVQANGVACELF
jgi:hypothetical protein